jgi:hypothetical protein
LILNWLNKLSQKVAFSDFRDISYSTNVSEIQYFISVETGFEFALQTRFGKLSLKN